MSFKKIKIVKIILIILLSGLFLVYLSSFFGWYGYEKWKYRRATVDIKESKQRGVFLKKLSYVVYPDTIKTKGVFYVERAYTYGLHSMDDTRILTQKDTKYPYQLLYNGFDLICLKKDNPNIRDSIERYEIFLKNSTIRDTIYFRLLKRKSTNIVDPRFTDTIAIVKVFDR